LTTVGAPAILGTVRKGNGSTVRLTSERLRRMERRMGGLERRVQ